MIRKILKQCQYCYKEYQPSKYTQRIRCLSCAGKSKRNREIVICKKCNQPFESKISSHAKFCCLSHTANFYRQLTYKYQSTKEEIQIIYWSRKLSYLLEITSDGTTLR